MKKVHLLSGVIALGMIASINAKSMKNIQLSVEEVQRRKLARQKELARKPVYAMLDALIVDQQGLEYVFKNNIDWPAIFHILDSMKGVISVTEYTAPDITQSTLLDIAAEKDYLLAAKTLLEKYNANPNLTPVSSLMVACEFSHVSMVKLLLEHGANPYLKDPNGKTSFDYARNKPQILDLLYKHTSPAKAA